VLVVELSMDRAELVASTYVCLEDDGQRCPRVASKQSFRMWVGLRDYCSSRRTCPDDDSDYDDDADDDDDGDDEPVLPEKMFFSATKTCFKHDV